MTHAPDRVRRHGPRPVPRGPRRQIGTGWAARLRAGRRSLGLTLLVAFLALLAALVVPGVAQAEVEGEGLTGVLSTSRSGPLEDIQVTVTDANGDEVDQVESDDRGRWTVDVPEPGQYTVTIDAGDLPDGVELGSGGDSRTVTVGPGRVQPVNFGLSDGTTGAGGGGAGRVIQLLIDGIRFGLLIAMAAVGLSLIFGTTGLVNFAHGELVTIGAVVAWFLNVNGGLPLLWATVLALIVGGAVGALNDLAIWRPLRRRGTGLVAALVVSIGLSLALRYLVQIIFGGRSRAYQGYQNQRAVDYGLFSLTPRALVSIIISVVVLLLVALMLQRTKIGKAMRAVSDNRDLAASSGINVDRVIIFVWALGGALATLGGVLVGLSDGVQWDMGFRLLLLMFAGVTLGGLGTAYGALVGSLVVGIFVQVSTLIIPSDIKYVGGLLLLIVILIIRPQGILGSRVRVG
ncbi:branched-chain amino acid ABC transporter permease [Blastococcus sp. PRF04-17]|uniref:branched-chain amino acid ABC transporter permease n=1 Tax=Blastococcus sp. PRF04-17 TaxID=2933797 RepID=UPI001FF6D318|nr:branched-chain amino acid ABC transporter permease [Blastococcus sp. PRF04-17]UOY02832.1 branched-chain amino acid ABC transporter permease [Blastococcus sp. PRF04-17]